mmetsp:Transcript_23616/g.23301  ORF Transcript_23616/g.23301 Transcript_23616/m.23301 type:complete len:151 (-) Transcript_23616:840-1292(-)
MSNSQKIQKRMKVEGIYPQIGQPAIPDSRWLQQQQTYDYGINMAADPKGSDYYNQLNPGLSIQQTQQNIQKMKGAYNESIVSGNGQKKSHNASERSSRDNNNGVPMMGFFGQTAMINMGVGSGSNTTNSKNYKVPQINTFYHKSQNMRNA